MLRRAKQVHVKAANKIDKAKNIWKERYLDERKKTTQLEQECTKYRDMLEKLHRELLAKTALGLGNNSLTGKARLPSRKVSAKISIARLLQEIEDLKRRVESNRFRLTAETKLKCVVEKDVKMLRQELIKKKIQITLTRNQEQSAADNSKRNSYIKVV
ncbi:spermatogenesis-associated protein 1-like [Tachypleus tridentatus]|uniref:spermatogenesis-associated protein 1-like n=1 Tax=Tachypleus tridentatus TaxID=6853 RepID=UPI003FCF8653